MNNFYDLYFIEKKDDFLKKIEIYKNLLNKFNKIHNLTNLKNIDENIIDSINILKYKDLNFAKKIIDIGSGAGFPAIFLSILLKADFYLFEPNPKKSAFLRTIKIELNLNNVNIIKEKIQNHTPFIADIITSRALMDIKPLIKICKNFYNEKTIFLLYKGSQVYEELEELKNYEIINNNYRNYCLLNKVFI